MNKVQAYQSIAFSSNKNFMLFSLVLLSYLDRRKIKIEWISDLKEIIAFIISGARMNENKSIDRSIEKGDKLFFVCLSQGVKFNVWQVCEEWTNNYYDDDHYNLQFNSIIFEFNTMSRYM